MRITLIPRVRPNYTFHDVIGAIFVRGDKKKYYDKSIRYFSDFFKSENILLTSSGRGSLYWILKSLPQEKVVIPAYTCMVVVEAALLAGKKVEFEKTDYYSFNSDSFVKIDSNCIVIATHQYGIPCDIERIVKECHKKGAIVIEDCAAAFGTMVSNQPVGTFGDYGFFSFDPSKLISVPPKGGLLITKRKEDYNNILKNYSIEPSTFLYKLSSLSEGVVYCLLKNKYIYRIFHYYMMGRKGKMQLKEHDEPEVTVSSFYTHGFYEWQAYMLLRQLCKLDSIIEKRKKVYSFYDLSINNDCVIKPIKCDNAVPIRYAIKVKGKKAFYKQCLKQGVDMGFSFNYIAAPLSFKDEHKITDEVLNIPFYYNISEKEMRSVVSVVNGIKS